MFTIEIDKTAIAITDADEAQAHDLFDSDEFKDDLRSMRSEGRPLWNGRSALIVRASTEDEIDAFDAALDDDEDDDGEPVPADDDGDEDDDEDGINVLFLIPIDPDDDAVRAS